METNPKYVIKNDIIFKYLFSNRKILKPFLEAFLNKPIKRLEVKEQFNVKAKNFFEKACYLDIYAIIDNSKMVNLEMQKRGNDEYVQRIFIYHSALVRSQVSKGDEYSKLKNIISINILNYILFKDISKYHTIWRYREDDNLNHDPLNSDEIHFIELPKFRKTIPDFDNKLNQWLAYIDETNPKWVKEVMSKNKVINNVNTMRDEFISDESNKLLLDAYEIYCMDQNTRIKDARTEGKAEGKAEEIRQVVINMFKQNLDIEIISKVTGLSINDINRILIKN